MKKSFSNGFKIVILIILVVTHACEWVRNQKRKKDKTWGRRKESEENMGEEEKGK